MVFDWLAILQILAAYALALPVGLERERHERSAGLRTFPLVAVAACGFMLVALRAFGGTAGRDAVSRVIQGLIGGVGFIGAGTIIHNATRVQGTATASSILVTGAIGMAVAFQAFDLAIILSALSFFTLRFFTAWKEIHEPNRDKPDPTDQKS